MLEGHVSGIEILLARFSSTRLCQDGEGHNYIIDLDTGCAVQPRSKSCQLASGGFAVTNLPNAQKAFSPSIAIKKELPVKELTGPLEHDQL